MTASFARPSPAGRATTIGPSATLPTADIAVEGLEYFRGWNVVFFCVQSRAENRLRVPRLHHRITHHALHRQRRLFFGRRDPKRGNFRLLLRDDPVQHQNICGRIHCTYRGRVEFHAQPVIRFE